MWYTGIDQHRHDSVLTTYGPDGPRVKQAKVANTPLAFAAYLAEFPGPHQAVVESTGGWYWLAVVLAPLSVELILAHATRLKAISAAKVKTDRPGRHLDLGSRAAGAAQVPGVPFPLPGTMSYDQHARVKLGPA